MTLDDCCRAWVSFKDTPQWRGVLPVQWMHCVLPFSEPGYDYRTMQAQAIDPTLVLAGNHHEFQPGAFARLTHDQVMDLSDKLVLDHPNDPRVSGEMPRYARVGSLPLYVALEGKNRVMLFKKARRPIMQAFVTPTYFPPAGELLLIRFLPGGAVALAHRGQWQILPFPAVTVPLLRAYGVQDGRAKFSATAWRRSSQIIEYLAGTMMRV